MRLMSIDPGGTTGFVFAMVDLQFGQSAHELLRNARENDRLTAGEIRKPEHETIRYMCKLIKDGKPDHVIIEDYVVRMPVRSTRRSALSPARIGSGIAYALEEMAPLYPVTFQMPSEMSVATDQRLKRWGLWFPGKPHACDAMRHMVIFLRKRNVG